MEYTLLEISIVCVCVCVSMVTSTSNNLTVTTLTSLFESKQKTTTTVVTVAVSFIVIKSLLKMFNCCNKKNKPRRMSFTSASIAMQPWPERGHMCDPIINAVIFMNDIPVDKELLKLVQFALTFERMSGGKF